MRNYLVELYYRIILSKEKYIERSRLQRTTAWVEQMMYRQKKQLDWILMSGEHYTLKHPRWAWSRLAKEMFEDFAKLSWFVKVNKAPNFTHSYKNKWKNLKE